MNLERLTAGAGALATGALAALALAGPAAAASGDTLLVCKGDPYPCPAAQHYTEIADAVKDARNGDWILVYPGTYTKPVDVSRSDALNRNLHIRGLDRNGVVLEGKDGSDHGIHVDGVDQTWVENMTGENFTAGSGNAFWWTGVDGYWGNYLTAYNTTNYGVYAYDSNTTGKVPSTFAFDYASWNADSGIYIGGCRDCNAVITNSKSEYNALGYSGTNAGGELYLINSEWTHNRAGIVPNTLTSEPDPPQEGAIIANNYIHDNNFIEAPGTGIAGLAPLGTGVDLAGGSNNIVRDNLFEHEKHNGVLQHWLFTPPMNNQIRNNRFRDVAFGGGPTDADIGIGGASIQTCMIGNVEIDASGATTGAATTDPPDVGGFQSCGADNPGRAQLGRGVYEPGNPLLSVMTALNAVGITEPGNYSGPGAHPEAQKTMDDPCDGAPDSAWCSAGSMTVDLPADLPKGPAAG